MKKLFGWLCVIGGLLWGVKPIYDVLFNGKKMNTGYIPSDPTDYIAFLFPFLCIGGLIVVYSLYKKSIWKSITILVAAVVLTGCFQFSEIYFYGSELPFGFLFFFSGLLCTIIGSLYLYLQLRKVNHTSSLLSSVSFILFLDTLGIVLLAFLSELLPISTITTPITAVLMILIGFIWSAFGFATLQLLRQNTADTQEAQVVNG